MTQGNQPARRFGATPVGFIGGGNMAQAMVRGLVRGGHRADRILVADPEPGARERILADCPGVVVHAGNEAVSHQAAALVLAVKPQVLAAVVAGLPAGRPARQLVLSVAAGITLESLAAGLGPQVPIVRAMPNQPALVGAGVTALAPGPGLTDDERALADYLAGATGKAVWLPGESLMDAVTAVSGSGPAYFYLLMELLEQAATQLGLPPDLARTLTRETALGAARTVVETGREPTELRAGVTSPGGTTAAAMEVLTAGGLGDMVGRALRAARDRSAELGRPGRQTAG